MARKRKEPGEEDERWKDVLEIVPGSRLVHESIGVAYRPQMRELAGMVGKVQEMGGHITKTGIWDRRVSYTKEEQAEH